MAEHWMYVPMAGFWWAFMELLALAAKRESIRRVAVGVVTLLAVVFLHQTITRNQDWHNNEKIFRATLAENPNTVRIHTNLAVTYDFLQGNYPGAARHYQAVIAFYGAQKTNPDALLPDEISARLSLAEMYLFQQKYSEALPLFGSLTPLAQQEAMKADGARATLGVGQCYLGLGDYPRAVQSMQQALSLDPSLAATYRNLMRGAPVPRRR
ncbi:MAG: tetratricopeptide repeat protein [Candidatus Hydrogenedentes bacterium]|nr:tetratricopeptide repeat protein [Candidatus Hydrogenedentota bacterium]